MKRKTKYMIGDSRIEVGYVWSWVCSVFRVYPSPITNHTSQVLRVALLSFALLIAATQARSQELPAQPSTPALSPAGDEEPVGAFKKPEWVRTLGLGGFIRADYYSASKKLNNTHSLPGLTFQPKALPKFGSWGDGKIEGRIMNEDLRRDDKPQARLLEAYGNLYFGEVDVRLGKQNIPWGRADALNPTDNLTPKDFTLLSARDEVERRTGSWAAKVNLYRGTYTLSAIWIPIFNPTTIPIAPVPGITVTEDKRNDGSWTDQGFALKLDQTGGAFDWSLSYYYGLDINPVGVPVTPSLVQLIHTRVHVIGADFAKNFGRYGMRGEIAYQQTQNPDGSNPFIKKPNLYWVLGVDRDLTDDLNANVQIFQRYVLSYRNPFSNPVPLQQQVAVLDATFNYQLDRFTQGISGRLRSTWFNKTLEGEILGQWNTFNRSDFFLRPSLAYAFTDVWKGFVGYDIFNGKQHSFFGRLEPNTAFFAEIRATF